MKYGNAMVFKLHFESVAIGFTGNPPTYSIYAFTIHTDIKVNIKFISLNIGLVNKYVHTYLNCPLAPLIILVMTATSKSQI